MKHKCSFSGCKKKVSLVETVTNKCKCNNIYCVLHKNPESHQCTFDYKASLSSEIMKNECKPCKVIKI